MSIKDNINTEQETEYKEEYERGPEEMPDQVDQVENKPSLIKRLLTAETGPRPLEEYENHALNFKNNKSIGKIIRGLEGLFGSLDLAIIDIIMGILEYSKEKGFINGKAGN